MEKILDLTKKVLNKEVILYVVFGILTTFVNIFIFFILTHVLFLEENLSNVIAIILAILFAYVTNSIWVFSSKLNLPEFFKFMLGRAFSMVVEIIGFFLLFNVMNLSDLISKIIISIIIIVLNYFISKYFAFKK